MKTPDAIQVLVTNQAKSLIDHGVPVEAAYLEAEERVALLLKELEHLGLADVYISVAIRRAQVYRLRSQGLLVRTVQERLGICKRVVIKDYKAEMLRHRERAS